MEKDDDARTYVELMEKDLSCVICLSIYADPVTLSCNHQFCRECILRAMRTQQVCPLCKLPANRRGMRKNPHLASIVETFQKLKGALRFGPSAKTPPTTPIKKNASNFLDPRDQARSQASKKQKVSPSPVSTITTITTPTAEVTEAAKVPIQFMCFTIKAIESTPTQTTHDDIIITMNSETKEEVIQPSQNNGKVVLSDSESEDTEPQTNQKKSSPNLNISNPSKSIGIVILSTGLTAEENQSLKHVVHALGGKIVFCMSDSVTHIVSKLDSGKPRYTMKYCFGIVKGCWLVSYDWVKMSEKFHCWQNEANFQLQERNTKLSLFDKYNVFLAGEFHTSNALNKEELSILLQSGGAKVVDKIKKIKNQTAVIVVCGAEHKLKSDQDIPRVSTSWVIESIVHNEARQVTEYAVDF